MFADAYAMYEGLPAKTKARIDTLTVEHDWHVFRGMLRRGGVPATRIAELRAKYPPQRHPAVRTHPETARRLLFVNKLFCVVPPGQEQLHAELWRQSAARLACAVRQGGWVRSQAYEVYA